MIGQNDRSVRGYDRLAPIYQALEYALFGAGLQRARVGLLDTLPKAETALVLGDGDGRLLEQLCRHQPDCSIMTIDQSGQMLKRQRKRVNRVGAKARVKFVRQDARNLTPEKNTYDLLVAAFFLDCFDPSELSNCLPRWLGGVRSGGRFYFVDFISPERGWRRLQSSMIDTLMHGFFRWQTGLPNHRLIDLDATLRRHNLSLVDSESEIHPMITCRVYRVG